MKLLLTILFAAASVAAQTPSPTPEFSDSDAQSRTAPEPAKPSASPIPVADLKKRAKVAKVDDELLLGYDKFKDKTSIFTKPQNIVSTSASIAVMMVDSMATGRYGSGRTSGFPTSLTFSIGYAFTGDAMRETPDKFALIFNSNSRGWVFLKGDQHLYFLLGEGQRLELEPAAEGRDIYAGYSHVSVGEMLGFVITREQLERIVAGGKNVELRLGSTIPRHMQSGWTKRVKALLDFTKID